MAGAHQVVAAWVVPLVGAVGGVGVGAGGWGLAEAGRAAAGVEAVAVGPGGLAKERVADVERAVAVGPGDLAAVALVVAVAVVLATVAQAGVSEWGWVGWAVVAAAGAGALEGWGSAIAAAPERVGGWGLARVVAAAEWASAAAGRAQVRMVKERAQAALGLVGAVRAVEVAAELVVWGAAARRPPSCPVRPSCCQQAWAAALPA